MLGGELSLGHTFTFGGDTPAIDTVKVAVLAALSISDELHTVQRDRGESDL